MADERPVSQQELSNRPRSKEDEYFRKKEQEELEERRRQRAKQNKTRYCVVCDGVELKHEEFENLMIDRCPNCNGVWLDAGELEHLTHNEDRRGGAVMRFFRGIAGR